MGFFIAGLVGFAIAVVLLLNRITDIRDLLKERLGNDR